MCCFCPYGGIWASDIMVEAAKAVTAAPAVAVEAGAVPEKMAESGVASLFRETGGSVASSLALPFISLVFCFSDLVFCFR